MQRRGFLPLVDSMQCLALAVENPPEAGEFRVFNQFENAYSISELAHLVKSVASDIGLSVEINHYDNPRTELEDHYYNPDRQHLLGSGLSADVRHLFCGTRDAAGSARQ